MTALIQDTINDIEAYAMPEIESIEALFQAIKRLATDETIIKLASHGAGIAAMTHNVLDCRRETLEETKNPKAA